MFKKLLLTGIFVLLITTASFADKSVTFAWNPNTESDLAGYRLYYGSQSGVYSNTVDLGNVITHTITLPDGEYFFALTAYDASNNESGYSNEVSTVLDSVAPGIPQQFKITIIINTSY